MLLTYFLNDFEVVPVAPIITGITFVFTFHMRCISIVRSLCFRIFSASSSIYYYYWDIILSGNLYYSSFTQTISRNGRQRNPIPFHRESESR